MYLSAAHLVLETERRSTTRGSFRKTYVMLGTYCSRGAGYYMYYFP